MQRETELKMNEKSRQENKLNRREPGKREENRTKKTKTNGDPCFERPICFYELMSQKVRELLLEATTAGLGHLSSQGQGQRHDHGRDN